MGAPAQAVIMRSGGLDAATGERALLHARALAYPRRVGSAGEATARAYIVAALRAAGLPVQQEEFLLPIAPSALMRRAILIGAVLLIGAALLAPRVPIAGTLVALPVVLLPFLAGRLLLGLRMAGWPPPGPRAPRCANLAASVGDPAARWDIIVVAHYDSISQRLGLLPKTVLSGASAAAILAFLVAAAVASPATIPLAGLVVAALIPLGLPGEGNRSPGTLDNASSVGVALALAEEWAGRPPRGARLTVLFTDAEEHGLAGACAFVRARRRTRNGWAPHVINMEAVGIPGRLRATRLPRRTSAALRHSLARAGVRPLTGLLPPLVMMDHMAFHAAGCPAVTLLSVGRALRHIHTPRDRSDVLTAAGLAATATAVRTIVTCLAEDA